jgi:hypothetical protein
MQNHDSENKIKTQESIIRQLQDKNKRLQDTIDHLRSGKTRRFSYLMALYTLTVVSMLSSSFNL